DRNGFVQFLSVPVEVGQILQCQLFFEIASIGGIFGVFDELFVTCLGFLIFTCLGIKIGQVFQCSLSLRSRPYFVLVLSLVGCNCILGVARFFMFLSAYAVSAKASGFIGPGVYERQAIFFQKYSVHSIRDRKGSQITVTGAGRLCFA